MNTPTHHDCGVHEFDGTLQKTRTWLKDVMERMHWQDEHRAYYALRIVLHALRDRLPVDEVVDLGAQLPMLIRGFYYEGWHPANKPLKERTRAAFLAHVAEGFPDGSALETEEIVRGIFEMLNGRLTRGEIEGVIQCLPKELRSLWPKAPGV